MTIDELAKKIDMAIEMFLVKDFGPSMEILTM